MEHTKLLLDTHPNLKEFLPFLDSLNAESERGGVLISSSYIENLLGEIIRNFLLDVSSANKLLDGGYSPLSSFSSRIQLTYCLGLISEQEYKELETIRKIRNIFAHKMKASFKDKKLVDLCHNLKFSAANYNNIKVTSSGRFTTSAVAIILNLINRPTYVSRQRLTYKKWPY